MLPVFLLALLLLLSAPIAHASWLSREALSSIIADFKREEARREDRPLRSQDRRPMRPFISGDGFRDLCSPDICESPDSCRAILTHGKFEGSCIYVKPDFLERFLDTVAQNITGNYVLLTHNSDISTPDVQTDAPSISRSFGVMYEALPRVLREYYSGRLLSYHAQNLWWKGANKGKKRPEFMHCLPIGLSNRYNKVGGDPSVYVRAMQRMLDAKLPSPEELSARPLLLVAFKPHRHKPDRLRVLSLLGAMKKPHWYNHTVYSQQRWLEAIPQYRFVLAPLGHGLDTHRLYEVLLMGGIPVLRRNSISSCFDDSDNDMGMGVGLPKRGSLPIVELDRWEDLNSTRLEAEWTRLKGVPPSHWDHTRLLLGHYEARIRNGSIANHKVAASSAQMNK